MAPDIYSIETGVALTQAIENELQDRFLERSISAIDLDPHIIVRGIGSKFVLPDHELQEFDRNVLDVDTDHSLLILVVFLDLLTCPITVVHDVWSGIIQVGIQYDHAPYSSVESGSFMFRCIVYARGRDQEPMRSFHRFIGASCPLLVVLGLAFGNNILLLSFGFGDR